MSQPTGVPSLDAIPMCAVMCEWTYREMSPLTRTGLTPPPGGSRRDGLPLLSSRGAERVGGPYAVRDAPVRETRPTGTPEHGDAWALPLDRELWRRGRHGDLDFDVVAERGCDVKLVTSEDPPQGWHRRRRSP